MCCSLSADRKHNFRLGSRHDHAGIKVAVVRFHHMGDIGRVDLLAWLQDIFEELGARVLLADLRELGANFAADSAYAMTLHALQARGFEQLAAAGGVAMQAQ